MRLQKPLLLMFFLLFLALIIAAGFGQKDHPIIKPIPGFILDDSDVKNFSSYTFEFEQNSNWIEKQVKGKYWFLYYEYTKEDRKYSELEIIENYKQAALEKGGQILRENEPKLDFTLPYSGGTIWVHLHAWENSYELTIIEEKGLEKKLEFSADEMKRKLEEAGRIAIYGIYFDIDHSNLKFGSEKVLIEMVKLMKNHAGLNIEIQGHTDTTGTREHNIKLSERRAETVKSFLVLYGVDPSRMTTKGYGPDQPVASNNTEEGRSLNRRVELKKIQ
jgi:outer membrane protein OmpA-like peptidoglycan-associated protein